MKNKNKKREGEKKEKKTVLYEGKVPETGWDHQGLNQGSWNTDRGHEMPPEIK